MYGLKPAGTRPTLGAYVRQLWRYRQFIVAYANGRATAAYSKSRLGRVWQILTPLANAGVYYLIFGIIIGTRGGMENFLGYLCTGVFIFTFTQGVVNSGVKSITGQIGLVRALHFPRAALPIAMTMTHLQTVVISLVVLMGIVIASGDPVTLNWLLLPPAVLLQLVFNLGLALVMARVGVKVPDVAHLMPYLLRTWMYASGVLYSVELFARHLPAWAANLLHANPLLVYIELARMSLLDQPVLASTPTELWIMGAGWALLTCVVGFIYFWRGESEYGRG
ncbi:MAG TPA: ABC transporter permease [Micromonosporaceae bacterium]|nr:ABC transporter permease [Micromonosporaceae bacterium]